MMNIQKNKSNNNNNNSNNDNNNSLLDASDKSRLSPNR